eukprot:TRINITY_DN9688_c0_g1_i2.p1 TRINITY_DN9688_c0_g1~~TRINITY_DN9688_c0_g1_i2.p1  ORF type:complete len:793 (+),score=147.90 TRINITY_DN9688_c0_g1_i2:45-2423(+)
MGCNASNTRSVAAVQPEVQSQPQEPSKVTTELKESDENFPKAGAWNADEFSVTTPSEAAMDQRGPEKPTSASATIPKADILRKAEGELPSPRSGDDSRTPLLVPERDEETTATPSSMNRRPPWGRFLILWVATTLCSGVMPGQALFSKICADAGIYSSVCPHGHDGCKAQFVLITSVFQGGQAVSIMFLAPIGILYDRWGARAVGVWGAVLCGLGLVGIWGAVIGAANGLDGSTSSLFVFAVLLTDFGSMLNSFSIMGLIWHFPGRQTLLVALISTTYQASAFFPLWVEQLMLVGVSLASILLGWTIVVAIMTLVCHWFVPGQEEYYETAKQELGMPLPRPPKELQICSMFSRAWAVLRLDTRDHVLSALGLICCGYALPGSYAALAAPYGEELFGDKDAGDELAGLYVLMNAILGVVLGPLAGSIADKLGLGAMIWLMCLNAALGTAFCGVASWMAQDVTCATMVFFILMFQVVITRYLLNYAPPNRFGTVQGVYIMLAIAVALPLQYGGIGAIYALPPGVDAYRIPFIAMGIVGVVGMTMYACYFQMHPMPEIPRLLEDDEADLAKSFGCGNLSEVMEVTGVPDRKQLIKMLATTDPEVMHSLIRGINTEKMMEMMSRRSVDDIADMMEDAVEEDADEEQKESAGMDQNSTVAGAALAVDQREDEAEALQAAPSLAPAAATPELQTEAGRIRERTQFVMRLARSGDKEGLRQYLLTEDIEDMNKMSADMEDLLSDKERKQIDKEFNKLIPGKEFAKLLRERPQLRQFVQAAMKREFDRRIASLRGKKKQT